MPNLVTDVEVTDAWAAFATLPVNRQSQLIAACSRAVEKWCNRVFEQATVIDTLDGDNLSIVWLSRPPIASIASVTVEGTELDNYSGSAWTVTPETGALLRGDGRDDPRHALWWPKGRHNIEVVYEGGFETIPEDVKEATIALIKHTHDLATHTGAFASEAIGDYSYSLADPRALTMPPFVRWLLEPYQLHQVV